MLYFLVLIFLSALVCFFVWPQIGLWFFLFLYIIVPSVQVYGFYALRIVVLVVLCCSATYRLLLSGRTIEYTKHFKWQFLLLFLFVISTLIVDIYHGLLFSPLDVVMKSFARALLPLALIYTMIVAITDEKSIFKLILVLLFFSSISCFVAVMQFFDMHWAWELRTMQGGGLILAGERAPGLSVQAVTFSYLLALSFPLALTLLMTVKAKTRYKFVLFSSFSLIACAVMMTLTRSLILGCLLSVVFIFLKLKKYKSLVIILFAGVFTVLLLHGFNDSQKFSRIGNVNDGSAQGRIPLAITAVMVSLDHPFGVGSFSNNYLRVVRSDPKYVRNVAKYKFSYGVLNSTCHNHFLNVLVYWGWLPFCLAVVVILLYCHSIRFVANDKDFRFNYRVAMQSVMICYLVNCLFHNGGPFMGDYLFWIMPSIVNTLSCPQSV